MTMDEIYADIARHMYQGMTLHDTLANYYSFLRLKKFADDQKCHFLEESDTYACFCEFAIKHRGRLITPFDVDDPSVIPSSWYQHSSDDVDISTAKTAIKNGFEVWIKWEEDTLELYSNYISEAFAHKDVLLASYVMDLYNDVSCEISKAKEVYNALKMTDWDLAVVFTME